MLKWLRIDAKPIEMSGEGWRRPLSCSGILDDDDIDIWMLRPPWKVTFLDIYEGVSDQSSAQSGVIPWWCVL